ncbi:hypothetical protein CN918_26075 [Priestia megaterium]|nr:hypothetical protein CN918_26075 [Priestia megaterium]
MLGLLIAVIIFNFFAFKYRKPLSGNFIVHLWFFTIAFQQLFDLMINFKYHGYWYFSKGADWRALIAHVALLPPVNMLFIRFFPFRTSFKERLIYVFIWDVCIVLYELLTLLPEPWGYFHYGWWKWEYSALLNPILLFSLIIFYKWTSLLEKNACKGP